MTENLGVIIIMFAIKKIYFLVIQTLKIFANQYSYSEITANQQVLLLG
jgi:hypothetical protein